MKPSCIVVSHRNNFGNFYTALLNIGGVTALQSPSITDCNNLIASGTSVKALVFFCDSEDFANNYKRNMEKLGSIPHHLIVVSQPSFTSFFKNLDVNIVVHSLNLHNFMGIIKSFGIKVAEDIQDSEVSHFEFVLNKLKNGDITLPVNNDAAVHVLAKLEDDLIHFKDLAHTVKIDPSIHSGIIKLSNSAYFGGSTQIDSLEKAMIRLGMNNVKTFLINYINKALIQNKQLIFIEQMKTVVDTSLDVASLAFVIASHKIQKEKEQMFSIGLIHNIGKIFLYATFSEMLQDKEVSDDMITQYENLVNANCIKIGTRLLKIWNFPESIIQPIAHHQEFTSNIYKETTLILGISCAFTHNELTTVGLPEAMRKVKLTKPDIEKYMEEAQVYKKEALSIFG